MARLSGKRVLITGAARGIGRSTATEFAKAGCQLVLTDIDGGELDEAARRLRRHGGRVDTYTYDVADRAQVEAVAERVLRELGGLDVLINNAGVGHQAELAETSIDDWRRLVDVNLWGTLYHAYAFLDAMKAAGDGQIVNVSSGQACFRLPTWGAYAAIKAAVGIFSEVLHFEVRKYGVHVSTVYPFMVNTPFYDEIDGDTLVGRLSLKLLLRYSMKPEAVGRLVFRAVAHKRRIEMTSRINDVGRLAQIMPAVPGAIAAMSSLALTKRKGARGAGG